MRLLNIEQNTEEWTELRRTHIGASDCPVIVGKSPYKTAFDLWEEKTLDKKGYVSEAMERGSRLEPVARELYEQRYEIEGAPQVVRHATLDYMIASLDGFYEDHILEIKCPGQNVLEESKKGKPQDYWVWQVQHQLEVTGLEHAVIFVYDEDNPEESVSFDIFRDEEMIKELLEAEAEFHECMINYTPPSTKDEDLIERIDEDWLNAENKWVIAKEALERAIDREKELKQALVDLSCDRPSKGQQVALTKVFRVGNVDYKNIPELQAVDLDKYRKEGTSYWKPRILGKTASPMIAE